jgi:hypothetical protein
MSSAKALSGQALANGNTCIAPLIARETRSTSFSRQNGIWLQLGAFWSGPDLHDLPEKITRTIGPSNALRAPMPGFKTSQCARIIIAGIKTMHMIRKGPLDCPVGQAMFSADQFYTLAI